jgi:hypothetical protein
MFSQLVVTLLARVYLGRGGRDYCLLQLSNTRGGSIDDYALCCFCHARGKTKPLLGCRGKLKIRHLGFPVMLTIDPLAASNANESSPDRKYGL